MPDGAKTLLVILLIPFLLGLGHDIYFNYFADDEKIRAVKSLRIDPTEFLISDTGWVWQEYAPTSLQLMQDTTEPATWQKFVNPILQLPTMVTGLIPWAITFAYLIFAWLAGFWPCANGRVLFGHKKRNEKFSVHRHAKEKTTKYKR